MRSLPLRVTVVAGFVALSVLLEAHSNERDAADRVQIVVSVFNRAGAPVQAVLGAETIAAKIYERGGVIIVWRNCGTKPSRTWSAAGRRTSRAKSSCISSTKP